MKILKRIFLIFLIILILLSQDYFAIYEDLNIKTYISKFEDGKAVVGIDVSSWQGEIDWKKVANNGVKFAIIRCGYRTKNSGIIYEDAYFRRNIEGAINNGIYVGVYFFSTAINEQEALEEANVTINLIKGYDIKYFVAYDFETFLPEGYRTDYLELEQINRNAKTFLNRIKECGYTSCIYGNSYDLNDRFDINQFSNNSIWVAHYNTNKPTYYTGRYNIWQCSSSGKVDGILTDVDVDIDYTYYFKYNNSNKVDENPFIDNNSSKNNADTNKSNSANNTNKNSNTNTNTKSSDNIKVNNNVDNRPADVSQFMFDARFYSDKYPDLKAAYGYNEKKLRCHYEVFGRKEGRQASRIFDPKYYLNEYWDLKKAYGNDYESAYYHFIIYGAKEGRNGSENLKVRNYLDNYSDLRWAYGNNYTRAIAHYAIFGIKEGRKGN